MLATELGELAAEFGGSVLINDVEIDFSSWSGYRDTMRDVYWSPDQVR
jgi:hypothetical protein